MEYARCAACWQMMDPTNPEEIAHHARMRHKKMPGIPDDGFETIPLDFRGVRPRSHTDQPPKAWRRRKRQRPT
jgi:hypothetical protein